jgi:putative membrane protein insertion efficiency factor
MSRSERARRKRPGAEALLTLPIRAYQLLVSPVLPPSCRFLPSCSDYAREAILRHGVRHGLVLALRRLARCHPWGGSGWDPVPAEPAALGRPRPGRG